MEWLAKIFDTPAASVEHRMLVDELWIAGDTVSVRYYLGRILGLNLFREADDKVRSRLKKWLAGRTSKKGALVVNNRDGWQVANSLLRWDFETETGRKLSGTRKEYAALDAYLTDPTISMPELAKRAGTTEKQLARMTTLGYARILVGRARQAGARSS